MTPARRAPGPGRSCSSRLCPPAQRRGSRGPPAASAGCRARPGAAVRSLSAPLLGSGLGSATRLGAVWLRYALPGRGGFPGSLIILVRVFDSHAVPLALVFFGPKNDCTARSEDQVNYQVKENQYRPVSTPNALLWLVNTGRGGLPGASGRSWKLLGTGNFFPVTT